MISEQEKYKRYHSSPLAIQRRSARNKARRLAAKKYGKSVIEGKDVDHINTNTGGKLVTSSSNIRVVPISVNRSKNANDWRKTKKRHT